MSGDDGIPLQNEENDVGPGQLYAPFITMESLLDKLKLLNYDKEFIGELKMKPLNRHYFMIPTPGGQFFMFMSIAAWLIRKAGGNFEQPQELDDPNAAIASILDFLRKISMNVDFPPNRLKPGYGQHVVLVLDRLADEALKAIKFKWSKPEPKPEVSEDDTVEEDDSELLLERVEEEMAAVFSDDEDDNLLNVDDLRTIQGVDMNNLEFQKPEEILESTTTSEDWQLELERVLPQLKVTVKSDSRDWRSHLQQMHTQHESIQESLSSTRTRLDKLFTETTQTMDKIKSREKFLNSQLDPILVEYRAVQDELARISEQYQEVNGGVTERQRVLSLLTEELDAVKQEMEERGSSMTDGTPLVNIKRAVGRMKNEIIAMNVQIGVLEHSLLQARLRDKSILQQDMNSNSYLTV
ncbi:Intraflagellar transport protein 57-like protein [Frankliniella fusca]|uniref:Intraflagellar transport protein 57-like protein n=1 Tax=Frankliniella fusca TaxID=407009 RepID=A0AAE1LCQ4_9NEOP|nr:Intraflagellar transport protein 57-like protein [Frankliniella fusca]